MSASDEAVLRAMRRYREKGVGVSFIAALVCRGEESEASRILHRLQEEKKVYSTVKWKSRRRVVLWFPEESR